jgi:hypothetical protein
MLLHQLAPADQDNPIPFLEQQSVMQLAVGVGRVLQPRQPEGQAAHVPAAAFQVESVEKVRLPELTQWLEPEAAVAVAVI